MSPTAMAPRRVDLKGKASAVGSGAEVGRELRAYRRVCREIDRLLREGRLAEARQLNDQARALFRHLYGSSSELGPPGAASRNTDLRE